MAGKYESTVNKAKRNTLNIKSTIKHTGETREVSKVWLVMS